MEIKYLICKKCEDYVFSFTRHSMNFCKCGNCALDGGYDYNRMTGDPDSYILVDSDIENSIEFIREKFEWTQNYDKNEKRLKKPITRKLKKLTTDHIVGILLYFTKRLKPYYKDWKTDEVTGSVLDSSWIATHEIFLEELKYRKLK